MWGILWTAAYLMMLVTVGWISVVNTGGNTATDANSKYGAPIILMIIGAVLIVPNLVFIVTSKRF